MATDHTPNDFSFHSSYQVTAVPQWGIAFHETLLNYCWSCDCLGFLYSLSRLLQLKNSQEQQSCHVQKGDFQNTSCHSLTFVKFLVELNRSDPLKQANLIRFLLIFYSMQHWKAIVPSLQNQIQFIVIKSEIHN